MIIRPGTAVRVPVRCINASGIGVAGITPTQITDGIDVGKATIIKANGTLASIVLVQNTNWFEISAGKSPGLYHLLVPGTATDIVGTLDLTVLPVGSAFLPTVIVNQIDYFFYLNYTPNIVADVIIQIVRSIDARTLEIVFNQRVDQASAETVANYSVFPSLTISKSEKQSDFHYRLTTSQQIIDQAYDVTTSGIGPAT